jgi:PASTA domain
VSANRAATPWSPRWRFRLLRAIGGTVTVLGTCLLIVGFLEALQSGKAVLLLGVLAGVLGILTGIGTLVSSDRWRRRALADEFFQTPAAGVSTHVPIRLRRRSLAYQIVWKRKGRHRLPAGAWHRAAWTARGWVRRGIGALLQAGRAAMFAIHQGMRAGSDASVRWIRDRARATVSGLQSVTRIGPPGASKLRLTTGARARIRRAIWVGAAVMAFLGVVVVRSVLSDVGLFKDRVVESTRRGQTATPDLTPLGLVVPRTHGLTALAAVARLSRAGLAFGGIEAVPGPPGTVVGSRPAPGTRANAGTAVVLFIGVSPDRLEPRALRAG